MCKESSIQIHNRVFLSVHHDLHTFQISPPYHVLAHQRPYLILLINPGHLHQPRRHSRHLDRHIIVISMFQHVLSELLLFKYLFLKTLALGRDSYLCIFKGRVCFDLVVKRGGGVVRDVATVEYVVVVAVSLNDGSRTLIVGGGGSQLWRLRAEALGLVHVF